MAATRAGTPRVVRSNYLWDEAAHLYEFSLKLWQDLSRDLNFNLMYSKRGLISLGHSIPEMRDHRPPGQRETGSTASTARSSPPRR